MRAARLEWLAALWLIAAAAANAAAQPSASSAPSASSFFVGGELFADADYTWSDRPPVLGASINAGADLTRHIGVQFTLDVPPYSGRTYESVRPAVFQGPLIRFRLRTEERSSSFQFLVRFHGSLSERVGVGVTSGLSVMSHAWRQHSTTEPLDPSGEAYRRELRFSSSDAWYGIAFGVDVPVTLTRHAALVPSARVIVFMPVETADIYIFRPGVGVRWTF